MLERLLEMRLEGYTLIAGIFLTVLAIIEIAFFISNRRSK